MDFEDAKKVATEADPKLHFIEFLQFLCHIALLQEADYNRSARRAYMKFKVGERLKTALDKVHRVIRYCAMEIGRDGSIQVPAIPGYKNADGTDYDDVFESLGGATDPGLAPLDTDAFTDLH